ncbi:RcnB family protein [Sphingomonas panacisoli]|uniref:RcnB family protein n=1 Tax=Sphingomonas panacisoli TaxID=1813879 RepID=A0A5B8LLK5_9SPHN|nr:RcnB family protein [Sphingomonas panacisoli]QDZ08412.1 RcnB family protein [Sphingomonas panacisoli]
MKRFLLVAAGMSLIVPDIALAYGQAGPQRPPDRPGRPDRPGGGPAIQPPRPGTGGPAIQPPKPQPPKPQPPRPRPPGTGGPAIQPPKPGPVRPKPPLPRPPKPPKPWRPGAGKPPNFRPIHRPGWSYPTGWAYRRWAIGLFLPRLFFATPYYYDSWWEMGLAPPAAGYRWVRYGPDLLLVQIRTRRIVDVIYGAFY